MGKGESAETKTHNLSSRQKENRGGCTCTLEEVQSGEDVTKWPLRQIHGRTQAAYPEIRLARPRDRGDH
jgi:hypothetical protein